MSLFSLLDAYNKRFYKAFLLKRLITIGCKVIEIISFVCFDQQKRLFWPFLVQPIVHGWSNFD